jgi:hypothetical protein
MDKYYIQKKQWFNLRYYLGVCLEGLVNTTDKVCET